ncbi:MAG: hypothetical protein AB1656_05205 [Candidatus Omnitrophota bacterium]
MFFPKLTKNRILLILILSLSVILSLPYLCANYSYNNAVKEAEAKGFIFDIPQLASPEIPDSQNASVIMEQAAKYLENNSNIHNLTIDRMSDLVNEGYSRRLTQEELEGLKEDLQLYNDMVLLAERAAQLDHARYNADYDSPVPFTIQVPNFMPRRHLVRLLQAKSFLLILEDRREDAYRCIQAMFRLSRLGSEESPYLIGTLIGFNLVEYSCQALEGLERFSPPNAEERAAIAKEIDAISMNTWLKKSIFMECASYKLSIDAFLNGAQSITSGSNHEELFLFFLRYPGRFMVRINQASNIRAMTYYFDLLPFTYYEVKTKNAQEYPSQSMSFMDANPPNLINTIKRRDKQLVNLDFAKISFALQEWKEKNNAYPADLASLKEILGDIPADPFSGQTYRYRSKDDGYTLYSLGWNLKDDGGIPTQPGEDENNQGDIVWSLP